MEIRDLNNKNILYISIKTFNYEKEIKDKLISFGANVDYFDERPSNSIFAKGIIRVKRSLYKKKIDSYFRDILKEIKNKEYDFFFLIKGEVIPSFFILELRKRIPNCKFIFYTWDSFENNPNALSILHFFDKKFTFDSKDAEKYDVVLRPLFYIDSYRKNFANSSKKEKYDLLFLGTAHSDRYRIGTDVVSFCNQNGYTSFAYYFMPSKLVYFIKKLFDSSFKEFDIKKLSFKSLDINSIIELYDESRIILDINHPEQTGLTMRTFEALGANKKLITTNNEIEKYPFYNKNNVFIINREKIELSKSFFETPFIPIEGNLHFNMSLSGWIKEIFINSENNYWFNGLN